MLGSVGFALGMVLLVAALVLWAGDLMPSTAGMGPLGADEIGPRHCGTILPGG